MLNAMNTTTSTSCATALKSIALVAAGRWRHGPAPIPQGAAVRLCLAIAAQAATGGHSQPAHAKQVLLAGTHPELDGVVAELIEAIGTDRLEAMLQAAGMPVGI